MAKFTFHFGLRPRFFGPRPESEAAQFGRDARHDWRAVFIGFLVLNLVSLSLNFYLYRQINQGELFLTNKKTPIPPAIFNQEKLERAVAHFEEKRKEFEVLQAAPLSSIPGPGTAVAPKPVGN